MWISKSKRIQTLAKLSELEHSIRILEREKEEDLLEGELFDLCEEYNLEIVDTEITIDLYYKGELINGFASIDRIRVLSETIEYIEENKTILELLKSKKKK